LKKFEHWDDKYNKENSNEVKKTQEFVTKNNIKFFEIYNTPVGIKNRFLDNLPYIFVKKGDTLCYFIPGGLFPTTREDFIDDLNGKHTWSFFVEGIRKDGKLGVYDLREYRFLKKENKVFYLYVASNLKTEEKNKLMDKLIESNSEEEQNKIRSELDKHLYYKSELIFDFGNQTKIGDRIIPEQKRFSQLLEITDKNNKKYYKIRTNVTSLELREMNFVFDNDCNFYLIEGHEIKK
jgi:hypothetical protein